VQVWEAEVEIIGRAETSLGLFHCVQVGGDEQAVRQFVRQHLPLPPAGVEVMSLPQLILSLQPWRDPTATPLPPWSSIGSPKHLLG
jgi:hypothetical protein